MPQKRVWFVHGKTYEGFWCSWCDCRRKGRMIRETFRWRCILSCGHVRANIGFTLPPEELERKGYINQPFTEDPRFTARKRELFLAAMKRRDEVLHQKWLKENLAGGKGVL